MDDKPCGRALDIDVAATDARVPGFGKDATTRRDFMKRVGAAGALAGLPALPANALAGFPHAGGGRRRNVRRQTLFFNLAHVADATRVHHLYLAGRKYRLTRVADEPQVLAAARVGNAFLRAVANEHITHHVVDVEVGQDAVSLGYWTSDENATTGTWSMTGMHIQIPQTAVRYAYAQARAAVARGALPLSNRRRMYGVRAARSLQDFREEAVLVDVNRFAEALVGLHPDLLSVEPTSAAHIHANYIGTDANTAFLAGMLQTMGPAAPADAVALGDAAGWATLKPLIDDDTGKPFKKSDKRLNQYYPDWSPAVDQNMAPAVGSIHPQVKDDPTLGVDVTGYVLNDPQDRPPNGTLAGTLWARHDGRPTVLRKAAVGAGSGPTLTFTNQSAETGLVVTDPSFGTAPDGRIAITFDNVSNWFLRWLGVWVQFLDPNGKVIAASALPRDTYPAEPGPYPRGVDKPDALFLGVVSPALAVMGVPVNPGSFSPKIYLPKDAASVRIFYTGLGLSGSELQEPARIYDHGAAMTLAFNYGVVSLFMAAGSSTYEPVFKRAVSLGGGAVATAISAIVGGVTNQASFIKGMTSFVMGFMKVLLQTGNSMVITALVEAITEELVEAEIIDSIPAAGQVARAVAAVVGVIQLAETSLELAWSPPAYVFDCVATHDLSVTFLPDDRNRQFPQPPAGYSLYYKVSYLFDNGTAHTLEAVALEPTATQIPITLGIPYGGQVNVSLGLYMRKSSTPVGQNDWCAGYATTGLVANDVDTIAPPAGRSGFPITETKVPIQAKTVYVHTRRSALDANGNHYWQADPDGKHAPPWVQPPGGQQPGLGDFDAITVRQGTRDQQGYVGYAWKAFSSGVNGCGGSAPGQFDQMANLNTDAGSNGANAQNGYINTQALCGYEPGVRIGYNLLTHKSLNMYLDTTTLLIRPVELDPPSFAGPASNKAFGMLNMDSTRCLLHPAGYVVSISNAAHKIEAVKLPTTAKTAKEAEAFHLARTYAGFGTRPGLISSPIAAAISPDGAILVLEAGNNRIQAFDVGGNPVPYFKAQRPDPHFLALATPKGTTYLDIAVEFTGYLYVLSKDGGNNHRLDIYHPSQKSAQPICTTFGLNAARLTVDFWRNVYSLNYEVLKLPNGNIPSFTEPSVSLWVPPPP